MAAEKKTIDIESMTTYEKLMRVRLEFLEKHAQQSGVNRNAEYEYFQLGDIIPIATPILFKYHLIFIITFPNGIPTGALYDFDHTDEVPLTFHSKQVTGAILSAKGNPIMTDIQSEGAKETYYRRYLYMQLLDTCVQDEIDSYEEPVKQPATKKQTTKKTAPKTAVERVQIAKQVSDNDGKAEDIQIEQIKKVLKTLVDLDSSKQSTVQDIVIKTENFTKLTKSSAAELLIKIGKVIDEVKNAK